MTERTPTLPAKPHVQRAFDRAAESYDAHAVLQREIANRLFERLDYIKLAPQRTLDLGSGTGYATRKLRERFPASALISLDIAPSMLRVAEQQLPRKPILARLFGSSSTDHFLCADAEALPLANASIDFILSNLAIQWCDPEHVAKEAARVLTPTGLFMFTTFGPDTLKELRAAFRSVDDAQHVNNFVDMHDIGDILVHAGFADPVMDQETITLTYQDLNAILRDLKGIGASTVLPGRARGLTGKSRFATLRTAYEQFRQDDRLPATFEVVYGHAWKPATRARKSTDGTQTIGLEDVKAMLRKR